MGEVPMYPVSLGVVATMEALQQAERGGDLLDERQMGCSSPAWQLSRRVARGTLWRSESADELPAHLTLSLGQRKRLLVGHAEGQDAREAHAERQALLLALRSVAPRVEPLAPWPGAAVAWGDLGVEVEAPRAA